MTEKIFQTKYGNIHYYVNEFQQGRKNLIFLPGLTADHRLFEKQTEYFKNRYNVLVWDAPGHFKSRPFDLEFSLMDKAWWLHDILEKETIVNPVLIGQSMGGYLSQVYMEMYPKNICGFISIDSAPLQRKYLSSIEIWMLKKTEPMYRYYPWRMLLNDGAKGVAVSEYGRTLMKKMMEEYDKYSYSKLAGHGYRMLADAVEADLPYKIDCPAILICGEKDSAGLTKKYNQRWSKDTGITIHWVENAGHNSNTDCPGLVNDIIENFIEQI